MNPTYLTWPCKSKDDDCPVKLIHIAENDEKTLCRKKIVDEKWYLEPYRAKVSTCIKCLKKLYKEETEARNASS